jgi:hypothetical protein
MTNIIKNNISKNRTCVYLLPILGKSVKDFKNLIQVYVGDSDYPEEEHKLYVLYEKDNYEEQQEELKKHPAFERVYSVSDKFFMGVYNLTEEEKEHYDNFLNGRYSKLKDTYKNHILNFHGLSYHSEIAKVLHRSEIKYQEWEKRIGLPIPRTQEIGSMPVLDEEIFKKEKVFNDEN